MLLTETKQSACVCITLLWMKPIVSDIIFIVRLIYISKHLQSIRLYIQIRTIKKSGINVGDSARYVSRPH